MEGMMVVADPAVSDQQLKRNIFPPPCYGMIEDNLHRSATATALNFEFLKTLHLKSVLLLSKSAMNTQFDSFLKEENIRKIVIDQQHDSNGSSNSTSGGNSNSNGNNSNINVDANDPSTGGGGGSSGPNATSNINLSNNNNNNNNNSSVRDGSDGNINYLISSADGSKLVTQAMYVLLDKRNYPLLICCSTGKYVTGVIVGCLRRIQKWAMMSIYEEYRRFAGVKLQLQLPVEQFIELFDVDVFLSGMSTAVAAAAAAVAGSNTNGGNSSSSSDDDGGERPMQVEDVQKGHQQATEGQIKGGAIGAAGTSLPAAPTADAGAGTGGCLGHAQMPPTPSPTVMSEWPLRIGTGFSSSSSGSGSGKSLIESTIGSAAPSRPSSATGGKSAAGGATAAATALSVSFAGVAVEDGQSQLTGQPSPGRAGSGTPTTATVCVSAVAPEISLAYIPDFLRRGYKQQGQMQQVQQ